MSSDVIGNGFVNHQLDDPPKKARRWFAIAPVEPKRQGKFTQVPTELLRDNNLSLKARLVAALLLSHGWYGDDVWPSLQRIGEAVGEAKPERIKRPILELVAHRLVVVQRTNSKNNHYDISNLRNAYLSEASPLLVDSCNAPDRRGQKRDPQRTTEILAERERVELESGMLSVRTVLRHYPIGKTFLYEIMREGKLPFRKLGGRTYILKRDLDSYFESEQRG